MARKRKKNKKNKKFLPELDFSLPEETQRHIFGIVSFVLALLFIFSYFSKAGIAGYTLLLL